MILTEIDRFKLSYIDNLHILSIVLIFHIHIVQSFPVNTHYDESYQFISSSKQVNL